MARINLSIPDELKEQMDSFADENWSRVAQDAFVHQVEINRLKGTDMQAASIERLRASKQTSHEREHAEGFALGKEWALNKAEYNDLATVADMREGIGGQHHALGLAFEVIEAIGEDGRNRMATEHIFDTAEPSDALVEGFIEGAGEVFDQV